MKALLVATGNSHKTDEIRAMLGDAWQVSDLSSHPDLPAVEETGTTFLENATLKAEQISAQVSGLTLSDDSGLEVDALGGEPGVYSARYAGADGDDAANNKKLLESLGGVTERTARFRCVIVLAENGKSLAHFDGAVEGTILDAYQGDGGFGYDPLFVPDGYSESFAQLGEQVKNSLSHRARAMQQVIEWLDQQ
ncbi:MAG: RdgB/HAM1 family non-canonical purine NTP pyrophosphatase [Akkermansiaceae bacterium]